ncbi:MAG: hypothetical protein WHT29_04075 [Bacteroidales bacterium]
MKRACIAVFTNEDENIYQFRTCLCIENSSHASSIRPLSKIKKYFRMKRACIAVFTNEYENNFSYLLDFRVQNILHASSIRPL